jgi:5'-3' exonuclease
MRLHLIDGTYELFRAHYSRGPSRTDPQGRDVKATVGVVSSLLALLADPDEQVTHLAIAFDHPIESFRNRVFAGYKDSSGVEEELLAQFGPVEVAVAALGVVAWPMDEYEADDALASAAARWAGDVEQVRILTPDKDLGQAVDGERVVQVDRARDRVLDAAGVTDKLGVPPASVPDHLALVGDTADGIPGLPGFGAKTSAALLARYGHLEAIPTSPDDWDVEVRGKPRLAEVLRERFDDALLYRDLATLRTDVELHETLDDLAWKGAPRDRWHAWCDELGVGRLRDRPHRWADAETS